MVKFDESRGFGVEIEMRDQQVRRTGTRHSISGNQIARWVNSIEGVDCYYEGYHHSTRPHWKVVSDSTCGWEVVSPILYGKAGLAELRKVLAKLVAHGVVQDNRCGVHVHHGMENATFQSAVNIGTLTAKFQPVFDSIVAPSRVNNRWADPMKLEDMVRAVKKLKTAGFAALAGQSRNLLSATCGLLARENCPPTMPARYKTVNFDAYSHHGTVEFRQLQGTLDADLIEAWIVFTQLIIVTSMRLDAQTHLYAPVKLQRQSATNPMKAFGDYLRTSGRWTKLEKKAWTTLQTAVVTNFDNRTGIVAERSN